MCSILLTMFYYNIEKGRFGNRAPKFWNFPENLPKFSPPKKIVPYLISNRNPFSSKVWNQGFPTLFELFQYENSKWRRKTLPHRSPIACSSVFCHPSGGGATVSHVTEVEPAGLLANPCTIYPCFTQISMYDKNEKKLWTANWLHFPIYGNRYVLYSITYCEVFDDVFNPDLRATDILL